MDIEISHRPGQSVAKVNLDANEEVLAEAGNMLCMDSDITVESSIRTKGGGGFLKGIKRALAGESLFMNTFKASSKGGSIYFAPSLIGDMVIYEMDGTKELIVQHDSYIASAGTIELDATWRGIKASLFSGEGLVWLRLTGTGPVILNSFGGIYEKDIDNDYIVDTGHIVAFENTLDFKVQKAGRSWFSAIAGGEMLVCRFSGKGKLYCQTHNGNSFGMALHPYLKPRRK